MELQDLKEGLELLGISLELEEDGSVAPSQLAAATGRLLQLYRYNLGTVEELKLSLQRTRSDVSLLQEREASLKKELSEVQKKYLTLCEKERKLIEKTSTLTSQLRAEQDEMKKMKLNMQFRESQHVHDAKKREKECDRLKHQLDQSNKGNRSIGMSMVSLLRPDEKRKTWAKIGSGNEEMYTVIISNYEDKQKELLFENSSLFETLATVQQELGILLNQKPECCPEHNEPEDVICWKDDYIPCMSKRLEIDKSLRKSLQVLREQLSKT